MLDLIGFLVDLVARPRRALQRLVSQAAQLGFAILAVPVGCAVLGVTVIAALLIATLLETLFGRPGIFWSLGPAGLVGGLVLAFVVLVRLYRAMPARVRHAIEIVDDDPGSAASPVVKRARALTGAELAALDAKLAPLADRRDRDG